MKKGLRSARIIQEFDMSYSQGPVRARSFSRCWQHLFEQVFTYMPLKQIRVKTEPDQVKNG